MEKPLCTKDFADTIESLSTESGGKLIFPAGTWLTGPFELRSNINLYLEMDAVIQFSEDEEHYPIIKASFEGLETYRCQSPLSAMNAINNAITENGFIDENGQFWRPVKKAKIFNNVKKLIKLINKYSKNKFKIKMEPEYEQNNIESPKEPSYLNLMAVISFNGPVIDGLILHPDNETIIFRIGNHIIVVMFLQGKTNFLKGILIM